MRGFGVYLITSPLLMRNLPALLALLLLGGAGPSVLRASDASSTSPAQVALVVTDFHSVDDPGSAYTDATTVLATHPNVTLASKDGLPTLTVNRPATIEVSVTTDDPDECYTPVAIMFEQLDAKSDPNGTVNFTVSATDHHTFLIADKFLKTGAEGRYEFYVLVRRVSDGALGVIDPGVENRPRL